MKKILIYLFCFFVSSMTFAGSINEMVFFGDSLSDNGNLYQLLKIVPKSPPYYQGRFSNGPTWAEHVANYYYNKSFIGSSNYSYGGATAILHSPRHDSDIIPILLEEEIEGYLLRSALTDKRNVFYTFWIGANDYLFDRDSNNNQLTDTVVNKIAWAITKLIKQGGHTFLILNLPDLSKTPYARENNSIDRLSVISQMHNKKLAEKINELRQQYPDVTFITYDVMTLLNDLIENTEKYNKQYNLHLTDTKNACWLGDKTSLTEHDIQTERLLPKQYTADAISNVILQSPALLQAYGVGKQYSNGAMPCDNVDEHVFWDALHPTAVIHQTLGQMIIAKLESENTLK